MSAWTPERRQAARERIMARRPWEHSTGPRTIEGKERSKLNGLAGGRKPCERTANALPMQCRSNAEQTLSKCEQAASTPQEEETN